MSTAAPTPSTKRNLRQPSKSEHQIISVLGAYYRAAKSRKVNQVLRIQHHPGRNEPILVLGMGVLRYIEYYLARLLFHVKGHDKKLFTNSPLFNDIPKNIKVESPDVGPSGSHLTVDHTQFGESKFPELKWSLMPDAAISETNIQEYMLICEDPDAPLPIVPNHGMYYAIPATKTRIGPEDIEVDSDRDAGEGKWLRGGFRLGKNFRGTLYSGPRPPVGHGEHRYFFQVVALKERVDIAAMKPLATRDELVENMRGKISGWGVWVGVFEHKW